MCIELTQFGFNNQQRPYSVEEKICIVLEDLRGEGSIAELCRQEDINEYLLPRVRGILPNGYESMICAVNSF